MWKNGFMKGKTEIQGPELIAETSYGLIEYEIISSTTTNIGSWEQFKLHIILAVRAEVNLSFALELFQFHISHIKSIHSSHIVTAIEPFSS